MKRTASTETHTCMLVTNNNYLPQRRKNDGMPGLFAGAQNNSTDYC